MFGLAFRHTLPEESGVWVDLWNYVYGFGGSWSDGEELTIDSPDNVEGLERFLEVYDAKVIPKGPAPRSTGRCSPTARSGDDRQRCRAGDRAGNDDTVSLSAAPIPFPVASQERHGPIVLNAASEKKEAAAVFLDWLLQQENQERCRLCSARAASRRTPTDGDTAPGRAVPLGVRRSD